MAGRPEMAKRSEALDVNRVGRRVKDVNHRYYYEVESAVGNAFHYGWSCSDIPISHYSEYAIKRS